MERLEANTIPVEGTIYYEGDNMETLYVAQAIDDNEQYQYDNATIEQDEQMSWEVANSETNQNQEDNSQVYNITFTFENSIRKKLLTTLVNNSLIKHNLVNSIIVIMK